MSIKSWESLNLEELCTIKTGDKDANEGNVNGKYPFFTCAQDISYSDDYSFDGQSILIAGNGNFNVKKFDGKFEAYQRTYVLQDLKVDFRYLYYYILGKLPEITKGNRGSTIRYIRIGDIANYPVPFPSFSEQNRIVDKIETLFSEVDAGIANLTLAKRQLEQYRQSLLKHAFEGKLTAKWREEYAEKHGKSLPNVDELLEQIQTARQDYYDQQIVDWEQAVEAWEEQDKEGKKPRKPSKLGEIGRLESEGIPQNWIKISAESTCKFITKGTTPSKENLYQSQGEIPFIKVYNLTKNGSLDFSINPTFTNIETHNNFLSRSKVYPNDILMNIVGPPLGKVSVVPKDYPEWNINQAIVIFRPFYTNIAFFKFFLLSHVTINLMEKQAKATAGQLNLTLEICRRLPIPVCSNEEQTMIVSLLESKLADSGRLINDIDTQLKKASLLKTSILHKAFQGKLVPQDPTDPPASELLAQIQAEREAKALAEKQAKQDKAASKGKTKTKSTKTVKKSKKAEQVKKEAQITLPL